MPRTPGPVHPFASVSVLPNSRPLQRKCAGCEDEEKKGLQRQSAGPAPEGLHAGLVPQIASSQGVPLPEALSQRAQRTFGPTSSHDFTHVRLHTDGAAASAARQVAAQAFTVGSDIYFGAGRWRPDTLEGQRLLGHELSHVVQQRRGLSRSALLHDESTYESEADRGGLAFEANQPATISTSTGLATGLQRVPDRAGTVAGRYSFSSNCGWIDWGHADGGLATRLIAAVRSASSALQTAGTAATATTGQFTTDPMRSQALGIVLSSASLRVKLLRPLSTSEVLEVALSIFKTLSIAFETQQEWTDFLGDSAFAQEDLPSNLLGFYRAARGFNLADIERFCGAMDVTASVAEYDRNHSFRKNRTFSPVGATGTWPAELSTINDSSATSLYEVERISVVQGTDAFSLCPLYRVVGTLGETSLFILSFGGTTFTASHDVRVKPTYRARTTTHGRYGHITEIEVQPERSSDERQLRSAGITWPWYAPQPILQCLTSAGNPG